MSSFDVFGTFVNCIHQSHCIGSLHSFRRVVVEIKSKYRLSQSVSLSVKLDWHSCFLDVLEDAT